LPLRCLGCYGESLLLLPAYVTLPADVWDFLDDAVAEQLAQKAIASFLRDSSWIDPTNKPLKDAVMAFVRASVGSELLRDSGTGT
jgi:hypothetical protein